MEQLAIKLTQKHQIRVQTIYFDSDPNAAQQRQEKLKEKTIDLLD